MERARVIFCAVLSGATAYAFGALIAAHEGPFRCSGPSSMCQPDELPGLAFLIAWPLLYLAADRMTRGGRSK